jgi:hypothetical protein
MVLDAALLPANCHPVLVGVGAETEIVFLPLLETERDGLRVADLLVRAVGRVYDVVCAGVAGPEYSSVGFAVSAR